jgi:NTP pyrophosphatase (non-canonical NTP hydrolase)
MTALDFAPESFRQADGDVSRLSAVLTGSFHRDPDGLRAIHSRLARHFNLLSPRAVEFVDPTEDFVRLVDELDVEDVEIEERHLEALRTADFVWLHAPDGYVGSSAAMELGVASAVGVPIFCSLPPSDPILADRVTVVPGPDAIDMSDLEESGRPGKGLDRLQRYYRNAAHRRGWSNESARDTLLLITEELGELARAVRKLEGMSRHQSDGELDVGSELADVQLYLVHLANGLGLDLSAAVTAKERVNASRFQQSRVA